MLDRDLVIVGYWTDDDSFFRVRFDRLTPGEKRHFGAMADLGPGPHRSGDVTERLGRKVNTTAPIRNSLIGKDVLHSSTQGDTAFTVHYLTDTCIEECQISSNSYKLF